MNLRKPGHSVVGFFVCILSTDAAHDRLFISFGKQPYPFGPNVISPLKFFQARSRLQLFDFRELWQFREVVWAFGMRDLKVRYRQTAVGVMWAVAQPLCTVAVFGILIHWLQGRATTGATPYIVTSLCGMVPWQFFATAITQSTQSVSANSSLLKKVYFPRVVLPLAAFIPAAVDFLIALAILMLVMAVSGIAPTWKFVLVPPLMALTVLCALAFSLWLSALNAIYRDVQFVVPFVLQLGMMMSPVVYESEAVVPAQWQSLYFLNPMAIIIQLYRYALLGASLPGPTQVAISFASMLMLMLLGALYFRNMERQFADRS